MEGSISVSKVKINALKKLKASIRNVKKLNNTELRSMFHLFSKYYEGHSFEQFQKDLSEKNHVILLKDASSKEIKGFSTILKVKTTLGNNSYHGIYSGDTVLDNEYWGSPALGIKFLQYLWMEKMKNPFRPLFWYLISKGYKTYLLMSNNFSRHYPRYETETPQKYNELMEVFYGNKFQTSFNSDLGLIVPKGETCHLKVDVADIKSDLLKIPRINFFVEKNPNWQKGVELCCIAEMTLFMPVKYAFKKFIKGILK